MTKQATNWFDGNVLCKLPQFGLLRISGADARAFLQGQLSCDVNSLEPAHARYGSYNTPQGRMLATFLLWRGADDYFMRLPCSLCETIRSRLTKFVLRAKVQFQDVSVDYDLIGVAGDTATTTVAQWFETVPTAPLAGSGDRGAVLLRLDSQRFLIVATHERAQAMLSNTGGETHTVDSAVWDWLEIRAGVPNVLPATQEQFVPQMANLDLLGGISFNKGCYPGQEIVARMHYLGKLKQRTYLVHATGDDCLQPGDKLYAPDMNGQAVGMIMNAARAPDTGSDALAVIQIDSAARGNVRLGSLAGPPLRFLDLPYNSAS